MKKRRFFKEGFEKRRRRFHDLQGFISLPTVYLTFLLASVQNDAGIRGGVAEIGIAAGPRCICQAA